MKIRSFVVALVLLFLFFVPSLTLAAPDAGVATVVAPAVTAVTAPAKAPAAVSLLNQLIEIAAYAIGLVLSALLGKLILAFEKKTKVGVPDEWETKLNALLDKGIHYAEEQGRKATAKLAPGAKLEHAADFVLAIADSTKVKELGKEALKKLIEARLGAQRAPAPNGVAVQP